MKHFNLIKTLIFIVLITLFSSCQKQPLASFTISSNSVSVGDTVNFANTSTDAYSYVWNFGDGNKSTDANPTHVYTSQGAYIISLTASNRMNTKNDEASAGLTAIQTTDIEFTVYYYGTTQKVENCKIEIYKVSEWSGELVYEGYTNKNGTVKFKNIDSYYTYYYEAEKYNNSILYGAYDYISDITNYKLNHYNIYISNAY